MFHELPRRRIVEAMSRSCRTACVVEAVECRRMLAAAPFDGVVSDADAYAAETAGARHVRCVGEAVAVRTAPDGRDSPRGTRAVRGGASLAAYTCNGEDKWDGRVNGGRLYGQGEFTADDRHDAAAAPTASFTPGPRKTAAVRRPPSTPCPSPAGLRSARRRPMT